MPSKFYALFLALFAFMFVSCEDFFDPEDIANINSEDFLSAHQKQAVVFHFAYSEGNSGELKGWIIDKEGDIRTYSLRTYSEYYDLYNAGTVDDAQLRSLRDLSIRTDHIVDRDRFRDFFKSLQQVGRDEIRSDNGGKPGKGTLAFYAYRVDRSNDTNNSSGSCNGGCFGGGCSDDDNTPRQYQQILLKVWGSTNLRNIDEQAQHITSWLGELHAEVWK